MKARNPKQSLGKASLAGIWVGLLFSIGCGIIIGYWRWSHGFFPGIQGMLIGLLSGTVAGRASTRGAEDWKFGYRLTATWLLAGTFLFFEFLGIGFAMPEFAPWQWITQTLTGDHIDLVIGPSRASGFPFRVSQVGEFAWLFFNLLDLLLQSIFTLLALGIALNSRRN